MNKVFLIGNLTRDPELSTTTSGISMCRLGLAVSRPFSNSNGERETDFFNLIAWRSNADFAGKYLRKGLKVAVTGSIQIRNYEGNNGEKRTATDIVVDDFEIMTPRDQNGEGSSFGGSAPKSAPAASAPKEEKVSQLEPVEDSELPF